VSQDGGVIKVCELVWRRPDLELDEFRRHWRDVHGPIVSAIPGIRRYVQSHPQLGGYRKGPLAIDGLAEIWVDDKDALRAMAATPQFAAAKADEPNFIDTSRLVEVVVDEVEIKPAPAGTPAEQAVKSVVLVRFNDRMAPADAHRYWEEVHGPLAASIPQVRRYVQSHLRPGAYRAGRPFVDGLATTWFDSVDDLRAAATTDELARVRADEPTFIDVAGSPTVLAEEHVLVG
jgi:uncharacterized protein (TIGR02118 family)